MAEIKKILDNESLGEIEKMIREGKLVNISVHPAHECKLDQDNPVNIPVDAHDCVLKHGETHVFTFESCRYGNQHHNAVSCILGHLNKGTLDKTKLITRKKIVPLISFKK